MQKSKMLIRKNTKAFKTIAEIINVCRDKPDREKLIRLYITKAGHSIQDRISVEGIQGESSLFYEMNYQAVLNNLKSSNHQLHHSDDLPGIYFFHSASNKIWDETPFEFDEAIKKEFGSLTDLPVLRKKVKAEKFIFPIAKVKNESPPGKKENTQPKKESTEPKKAIKIINKGPKQPDYKLKREIHFTDLDKIIFRSQRLPKKDVLDYYNKISAYLLPFLKDRPVYVQLHAGNTRRFENRNLESTATHGIDLPDWIQTSSALKGKNHEDALPCNDKEHVLFYVENGCVEFNPYHSRVKSITLPDYLVIVIESPENSVGKAIPVALAAKEILSGLQLPSFIKTDGVSGFHLYVPLDAKSKFQTSKAVAEYLCKLIRIKVPDLVTFKSSESFGYGKVSLDYSLNEEGKRAIAPYSLVARESVTVATPLLWEEVNDGLRLEDFNHETIFKRLKQIGDPFENFFKKRINAETLLEKMQNNYSFLL